MTLKNKLESRLRGWFPHEPTIVILHKSATPKALFGKSNWTLRIIAGVFVVFSIYGLMNSILQTAQVNYLPFNVRFIITAVSVLDYIGMFVVGVGLLTGKRRWIDTAIIYCIMSIILFYAIPMRAALPLELVMVACLFFVRYSPSSMKALTKVPTIAPAIVCIALLASLAPINAAILTTTQNTGHTIADFSQVSTSGNLVTGITVYSYPTVTIMKETIIQ
jgi:hypothetical protein